MNREYIQSRLDEALTMHQDTSDAFRAAPNPGHIKPILGAAVVIYAIQVNYWRKQLDTQLDLEASTAESQSLHEQGLEP